MPAIDSTWKLSYETALTAVSARSQKINEDLTFNIESLSDNELTNGVIVFDKLSSTQRDAIMQFYTDNKDSVFDFTNPNDGITYQLYFIDPVPKSQAIAGYQPLKYTVTYTVAG